MFSGIVQTVGKIESIKDKDHIKTIRIETHGNYPEDIDIGQCAVSYTHLTLPTICSV